MGYYQRGKEDLDMELKVGDRVIFDWNNDFNINCENDIAPNRYIATFGKYSKKVLTITSITSHGIAKFAEYDDTLNIKRFKKVNNSQWEINVRRKNKHFTRAS